MIYKAVAKSGGLAMEITKIAVGIYVEGFISSIVAFGLSVARK